MSANHDIKSRPPAAHFATILCTKSQHCGFVAGATSTFEEIKSLTVDGTNREQSFLFSLTQRFWFIAIHNWQTAQFSELASFYMGGPAFFGCWLASAGDGRRCSSGNSIWGRPPPPLSPPLTPQGTHLNTLSLPGTPHPQSAPQAPARSYPLAWTVPTKEWLRNDMLAIGRIITHPWICFSILKFDVHCRSISMIKVSTIGFERGLVFGKG